MLQKAQFSKKLRFSIINLTMKKLPKLDELGIEEQGIKLSLNKINFWTNQLVIFYFMNENPQFLLYPREAMGLRYQRNWRGILGPCTKNVPVLGIPESVPFLLYRGHTVRSGQYNIPSLFVLNLKTKEKVKKREFSPRFICAVYSGY